jgi:hypothetical protein
MESQTPAQSIDLSATEELVRLEAQLQCRLGSRVCDLRLTVRDGGLILRGYARTYHAKQLAQHALMEATKLRLLANEIRVC